MSEASPKAVVWHTDVMALFSETESCLICLTDRQRYLLGQCLEQMRWQTRWIVADGDVLPDIDSIASELEFKLMDCTDLCQEIITCIETTPELQQAIAQYANSPTLPANATLDEVIGATDVLEEANIVTCNNDNLFGATTGIVDLMNEIAEDLIEILSNNASLVGRVGDAIEGIPIIGEFPLDDVFQLVESFVDDMEQLYQANYTVATRDQYRCDLFCIAKDTCSISFDEIYDYFVSEFGQTVPTSNIQDFIIWFATNSPANSLIVPAWHVFLAGILKFGGAVLDIDSAQLITMVSAMYNDPDPDHATLCDCSWTSTLDFTTSNYGAIFIVDDSANPIGSWVDGTGFIGANVVVGGTQRHNLIFRIPFDDSTIESYTWTGSITKGNNCDGVNNIAVSQLYLNASVVTGGTDFQTKAEFPLNTLTAIDLQINAVSLLSDEAQCNLMSSHQGQAGSVLCTGLTITGSGTKPPQLP